MRHDSYQRAIEAQVEERRRKKEKEEAIRQAREQEEEQRLTKERELLQQQYLRDTQLQREKEVQMFPFNSAKFLQCHTWALELNCQLSYPDLRQMHYRAFMIIDNHGKGNTNFC